MLATYDRVRPVGTPRRRASIRNDAEHMIVGATVFAGLILLLLLAERGSGFVWHGGRGVPTAYCPSCDLRYRIDEVAAEATACPRGHLLEAMSRGFPFTTFLIAVCVAFIALGGALIVSGRSPGP
ncbi:MAG TPA: hypothetical protein VFO60_00605 [Candidatus Dormibacteraeota bacterium]|nr:hypothetical protein [Candidatus Dormibacteraeota bacterium]